MSLIGSLPDVRRHLGGSAPRARAGRRRTGPAGLSRLVTVAVTLLLVSTLLGRDVASASHLTDGRTLAVMPPDPFGVRAKSAYEQTFNPFGDEWATKGAPNVSIPIGLTPACYKHPPKDNAGFAPEEVAFVAKSNSPLVWENCADVVDASAQNPNGSQRIKANIAAVKAVNAGIKYIGFLALARADIGLVGNSEQPVGLTFIDANREDWFVHVKGAAPTRDNRVVYSNGTSRLYDVTNPEFRAFMVARIVESLNYHGMDGFVLGECLDQPTVQNLAQVPDAVLAGWDAGCMALMAELRAALDPIGKLLFFTGYQHLGTAGQPDPINEDAKTRAFQQRIDRSHGFFWEDAFRGTVAPPEQAEFAFERYKRNRDYAVARGRYIVNIVNTFAENQSTFDTTNQDQQRYLQRYYLGAFLAGMTGPLTVQLHYTPTSLGPQFFSNTFFKDWDLAIGAPTGADTKPAPAVYQREFQNARVVWNTSSGPFTVNLSDGQFTNADGQQLGGSAVVPAKSGAIFLRVAEQVTCAPRSPVRVRVTNIGGGAIQAELTAGANSGSLRSVQIVEARTASVDIEGGPTGITGAFTHPVAPGTTTVRLIVRKSGGNASTVRLIVTDGCGEWRTFVGAGPGVN